MALNKDILKAGIVSAFKSQLNKEDNIEACISDLSDQIAQAVINAITMADVITNVTGTCATPAGAGTIVGTGFGNLS